MINQNPLISVSGHQLEVTEGLKNHVHKQLQKVINHFKNITKVHVTLQIENKFQHTATAEVTLPLGHLAAIGADTKDMYTAINRMVKKLDDQVVHHKEKLKNHRPHDEVPQVDSE
jgi:putative sigma-54 modulation protein